MSAVRSAPLVILTLIVAGCSGSGACTPSPPDVLFAGGATLQVEVATTPTQQARGLMGRGHLAANQGMLFEFGRPTRAAFWMKDTLIPLSIAFYDPAERVIAISDMTPCRRSPCRRYRSPRAYVGAIEANRGYFERHGIGVGDHFTLERSNCAP